MGDHDSLIHQHTFAAGALFVRGVAVLIGGELAKPCTIEALTWVKPSTIPAFISLENSAIAVLTMFKKGVTAEAINACDVRER